MITGKKEVLLVLWGRISKFRDWFTPSRLILDLVTHHNVARLLALLVIEI